MESFPLWDVAYTVKKRVKCLYVPCGDGITGGRTGLPTVALALVAQSPVTAPFRLSPLANGRTTQSYILTPEVSFTRLTCLTPFIV